MNIIVVPGPFNRVKTKHIFESIVWNNMQSSYRYVVIEFLFYFISRVRSTKIY